MIDTKRLSLPLLLPAEPAACEQCLARISEVLQATKGVAGAHVDRSRGTAVLHYDPDLISLSALEDLVQREGARLGQTYVHQVVPIEGMDCADCAMTLERGVGRLRGVEWVSVNFAGARMALEFDAGQTSLDAVGKCVKKLGYAISAEPPTAEPERAAFTRFLTERANLQTLAAAGLTLIGGLTSLTAVPTVVATVLYAAAILVAGFSIARKGLGALRATHQLDINVLMTIAVIGAAAIGQWMEGATVVVLFSLGEALEGYTMDRARRSIRSLMHLAPAEAMVRDGEQEYRVPVAEVTPGTLVIVRAGERIPLDGKVVSGESAVNQAPITGESLPVDKAPGGEVFAGTVNGTGVLEVRVTRQAGDSTIARIIRMVEDAQAQKAPSQRFVDVFAKYYTPAVVILAALVAVLPPLLAGADWLDWLYRALVLLVIACPCALVISTPVSIVSAISAAARSGVLIKGGTYLEAAGSLRALAFDKTGTLTHGTPEVTAVMALDGAAEDAVLRYAAAAERYSEHPLGEAIVRAAADRGVVLNGQVVESTTSHTGRGIAARVDGVPVRVGNRAFVLDGTTNPQVEERLAEVERSGQTAVLVAVDDQVIGIIGLADTLRPDARAAVQAVKRAGIENTIMLTGDQQAVAEAIAAKSGVDAVEAELMPGDKVRAIERLLERYGKVGMVGDGVNDAPALARSTVGIAMGAAGTDTALETADIALMSDDLGKVAYTMRLSRAAKRTITQNIGLALVIKVVFLALAVVGLATLWMAVFADVGASLIVIANGMRLLRMRSG